MSLCSLAYTNKFIIVYNTYFLIHHAHGYRLVIQLNSCLGRTDLNFYPVLRRLEMYNEIKNFFFAKSQIKTYIYVTKNWKSISWIESQNWKSSLYSRPYGRLFFYTINIMIYISSFLSIKFWKSNYWKKLFLKYI